MKRIWPISDIWKKLGQVRTTPSKIRVVLLIGMFILGVVFLVFGAFTIRLGGWYNASNGNDVVLGAFTYVLGLFTILAFLGLSVFASLLLGGMEVLEGDKVLGALCWTLLNDPREAVRVKAAEELAKLDMELDMHHREHEELDGLLISRLDSEKETSTLVRSAVAEGLGELEVEEHSFPHELEEVGVVYVQTARLAPPIRLLPPQESNYE